MHHRTTTHRIKALAAATGAGAALWLGGSPVVAFAEPSDGSSNSSNSTSDDTSDDSSSESESDHSRDDSSSSNSTNNDSDPAAAAGQNSDDETTDGDAADNTDNDADSTTTPDDTDQTDDNADTPPAVVTATPDSATATPEPTPTIANNAPTAATETTPTPDRHEPATTTTPDTTQVAEHPDTQRHSPAAPTTVTETPALLQTTTPPATPEGGTVTGNGPAPATTTDNGAPVENTPTRIVAGILTLFGYNPHQSSPNPTPAQPALIFVWAAWQQLNRRYLNSAPNLAPTGQTVDTTTGTVTGTLGATDPDRDTLTYTLIDAPDHGTVTINPDGTYTYTPDPTYAHALAADPTLPATDTFTITATDGQRHTYSVTPASGTTATITVPVTAQNQGPSLAVLSGGTYPDNTSVYILARTDGDGDDLVITHTTPAHGTIDINDHGDGTVAIIYVPDADYAHQLAADGIPLGSDTFTVTADDGHGGTSTVTLSPLIAPVNSAPVLTLTDAQNAYNSVSYTFTRTDGDGDDLTTTASSQRGVATVINNTDGSITVYYGADPDYVHALAGDPSLPATDTITVTTTDGHGGTTTHAIPVTLYPFNNAPTAGYTVLSSQNSTRTTTTVGAIGTVGGRIHYEWLNGSAVSPDGRYVYMPSQEYQTGHLVILDTTNGSITKVTVGQNPQAVALSPDGTTAYVANFWGNSVSVVDTASGTVTHTIPVQKPTTVAVSSDGRWIYVGSDAAGPSVAVIDAETLAVSTVPNVSGDAAYIVRPSPDGTAIYAAHSGTVARIDIETGETTPSALSSVGITDIVISPDGDTLYVTGGTSNSVYVLDSATMAVTKVIPLGRQTTAAAITPDGKSLYVATVNGQGNKSVAVIDTVSGESVSTLAVTSSGYLPNDLVVSPDGKTLYVTDAFTTDLQAFTTPVRSGVVTGSDADEDALIYAVTTAPSHGTVVIDETTGAWTYTGNQPGVNWSDTFVVTVSDGHGGSTPVAVTVNSTTGV